ncbi:MAG: peroxiredoxin [bacterium]|nr:peroxiredoxin [bacterium]
MTTYEQLPGSLPQPVADGAADHLLGLRIPSISLPATSGQPIDLSTVRSNWTVLYVYPMTGRPGFDLPEDWDNIPGARGCTPQSCGFRDYYSQISKFDVSIYGLSVQDTEYQQEAAMRLNLPFALLSDSKREFGLALKLPTMGAIDSRNKELTLYRRLTMIVADCTVKHVMYPVFPPDENAANVYDWLSRQANCKDL